MSPTNNMQMGRATSRILSGRMRIPRISRQRRPTHDTTADDIAEAHEHVPTVPPVVVPRWIQLVVLPLALLGAWALARAAKPVVLILVVASVVALILNPLAKLVQRAHVPRPLAILV